MCERKGIVIALSHYAHHACHFGVNLITYYQLYKLKNLILSKFSLLHLSMSHLLTSNTNQLYAISSRSRIRNCTVLLTNCD